MIRPSGLNICPFRKTELIVANSLWSLRLRLISPRHIFNCKLMPAVYSFKDKCGFAQRSHDIMLRVIGGFITQVYLVGCDYDAPCSFHLMFYFILGYRNSGEAHR